MRGKIGDKERLNHISDCINEIETAVKGINKEQFVSNHVLRIAVVKWLEIIGEAANYISAGLKEKHPGIEWKKITGLRNIVVHEYFGINYDIIWLIVKTELDNLKNTITDLLKEFE
ncbi:MAG: DUF86 domain-containing protein [Sphingobacteriales bacterium]|nr:DUF86 domain-containing protein [Sphingobacteriales bacterium]